MSEKWIQNSERILKQIESFEQEKERDRLDLVRSIRFMLGAIQRSLLGWMQWVNNPDIIAKFNQEELVEIDKVLANFVKSFIEYDIKLTTEGLQKGLVIKQRARRTPSRRSYFV